MASSGSVDYTSNRDQLVQAALEDLGVMQPGDSTSSASFTDHDDGAFRLLNDLVKQYGHPQDGSPGLQAWTNKTAYLFLQKSEGVYTLGPTTTATGATNKWSSSYGETTISAAEAAGQTVITVVDNGTIADTNRIGIVLDSGSIQWTTVSGTPTDNGATLDVTIAAALTGAAAAGNKVVWYATTTQGRRPLRILTAVVRDSDDNDRPIEPMTLYSYEGIATKLSEGTILRYYYQNTLTDGTIFFDCESANATDVVRIVYQSPFEDFDASTDTMDFDPVWSRALRLGLVVELAPRFGQEDRLPVLIKLRDEALAIARNAYAEERADLYFQPGCSE